MIPLTIIGGYLGAGKTTLINRLLAGDHGLRLAVLVNDFGEVNIDAGLIATDDGDTYTLTNGCICCSFGDDLSGTLIDIARSDNPPDEVFIEASGVADATRFATYSGEWIGFDLRGVLVLADIETIQKKATDKYVGDLVVQQLKGADLIVLNKTDLVAAEQLDNVRAWLEALGIAAPVIATAHAEIPLDVLFDVSPLVSKAVTQKSASRANHEAMFASTVIRSDEPWQRSALEGALDALPKSVVRAKGTVALAGSETPVVLQLVGRRWQLTDAPPGSAYATEIVLIGVGDEQSVVDAGAALAASSG